jgi:hypothetical protein
MNRSEHLRDEELGDALNRVQQRHLDRCRDCAHRRSTILAVREAIHALPRTAEPPAATMALLAGPIAARFRPRWHRGRWGAVAGVAAAVVAAVVLFAMLHSDRRGAMNDALAQEIALDHLHYEHNANAAEVSGSPEQIGDYFARTLQRRPHLAQLEAANVVGGKRCRIGGEWSALIWLERAGRWLSLFSMPQEAVASRSCVRASGVNVCGVADPRGGSRVLAGNLPEAEMLRLLDESMK